MRLKSFAAPTMKEAMHMVRDELGPDAVIVSTRQSRGDAGEVRITAAVEQPPWQASPAGGGDGAEQGPGPSLQPAEVVRRALEDHGAPPRLVERIVIAARVLALADPTMALAAGLDDLFRFTPLPERDAKRPIMPVGPPGAGKTIAVVKLAAQATIAGARVRLIAADAVRAGAVQQLAAFARLLKIDLHRADGALALSEAVAARVPGETVLIDSPGANPFDEAEMAALEALVDAAGAEPVLVLAAGADAIDSAETAKAFASLGAERLLATKLDAARRLGGLLAAADAGRLRFCNVSHTANVGKGLSPINPISLARLLLPLRAPDGAAHSIEEAIS